MLSIHIIGLGLPILNVFLNMIDRQLKALNGKRYEVLLDIEVKSIYLILQPRWENLVFHFTFYSLIPKPI